MLVWTIFHERQLALPDHGSLFMVINDFKLSLNGFNQNVLIPLDVNILVKWKRNMLTKENVIGNKKYLRKEIEIYFKEIF